MRSRRVIGFGRHQAIEFLLGVFLVMSSARVTDGNAGPVLALGMLLVVLPVVSVGPLAAVKVLSPSLHRVVDVAVAILALASPLLPVELGGHSLRLVMLGGLALALLARSTSYVAGRGRVRPKRRAPDVDPTPRPPTASATTNRARGLGAIAGRARSQLPRQAGRTVGRLLKRAR